jgi:hypothetical protein
VIFFKYDAKTMAEHGTSKTEERQTLVFKIEKLFRSDYSRLVLTQVHIKFS